MKHADTLEFANAAAVHDSGADSGSALSKAWWIVPFVGLGAYLWVQMISAAVALFT